MWRFNVILTADVLLETDVIQLAAEFIMSCYDYYMYYIECESADIVNYICFKKPLFSYQNVVVVGYTPFYMCMSSNVIVSVTEIKLQFMSILLVLFSEYIHSYVCM